MGIYTNQRNILISSAQLKNTTAAITATAKAAELVICIAPESGALVDSAEPTEAVGAPEEPPAVLVDPDADGVCAEVTGVVVIVRGRLDVLQYVSAKLSVISLVHTSLLSWLCCCCQPVP